MIVAVMTTALAGTAWAQGDYSTDYTGNVTLSTTGGTSASTCVVKIQQVGTTTVNSYDGIKAGTSSKAGAVKITVPSGTKYLHLHTAAWNNESVKLAVSSSAYNDEISLTSDSGVSGNSPFTLGSYDKASTDYYKVITFDSALTEATDVTFTAKSGRRFVVWGVTAEDEGSTLAVATSVVISDKAITNTDVHVSDEAGSLSATVVAGETTLSGATVTWSGNNDAVATIDASTGAVTLVGAGVVTFTAAYAGVSGEYKASSANYEMTVTDSTPFTGGDVTFDATADKGNTSQGAGSIVKHGVTFACDNGVLGNGSEYRIYKNSVTTFTLSADAVASGYVIKSIAFTCTGSNPASGFGDQEGWTTEGSNGTWTGAAASVSFTASGAQVRATEIVVTVGQQAALSSIEVSGDYPTSFHAGDAFSHEGIVVTATYDDSTTRDVTALATFSEPDMTSVGIKTVTVSYSEGEVTETTTYQIAVNAPATLVSISLSGTYPTEFGQGDAFSSEGIEVTAHYDDNTTADVTANATFSGYDMNALGEQTVTVSYEGKEATYTINVVEKKGTATNPYTVAEARAAIDAGTGTQGVYVAGIVSKIVTAFNSQFGNISYNISADGTEAADQLQAYRGKSYNGDNFTSADDIQVGDTVVVYGNLTKYNSTYEFAQDNQLVSLIRPVVTTPSINLGENEINAFAQGSDGVILVGYENITTVVAEVFFCDADGNAATYDWVAASINDINNLEYIIDANTSTDARTAYMKVHALDDDANDVYSELITINQAGYVAPAAEFATLPFSFDGGKADIETTDGLTQEGLDSDYGSSPKLKFNSTGDYVVLAFNERPGKLTFDIKGNSFSGSTFTVQTSEDGVTYTDLETYTELGTTQSEEFDNLGENVRYIKWLYTEKVSGNVALGNIELATYTTPVLVASITVDPATVNATAAETIGALELTYANFTVSGASDFDIEYYDEYDNVISQPNWIDAEVEANGANYVVSYIIAANNGDARTASFKVYALDSDANYVYSNVVTVNQAAYVAPATGDQYALFTGDLVEGDYIICYNGYAMNTDVENGRLMYATVTPESDVITTSNAAIVWHIAKSGDYWTIYNAEADAYAASTGVKNKAQMLADGTDDMALWTVSGTDEYEFVNKANSEAGVNANLRNNGTYGFACYAATTGGALSLYKKVGVAPASQAVTVSAAGYATLVAEQDLDIPAGVEVFAVQINGNYAHLESVTAGVPAGEAVVVKANAGDYSFTYATSSVSALTVTNDLVAATAPVTADGTQYVLAKPAGEEVGFYQATAGSTIAAGKAYLQITGTAPIKGFTFIFDDDATGIEMVNGQSSMVNDPIFNLAGQRIQKLQRGINIVGGKKMLK